MEHPVIYARNNLAEWVDVADRLYEEKNWYPAYWIAPDTLHESIADVFTETVLHSSYDADRSIPPTEFEDVDLLPLDAELLEQYRPYEHLSLRMMDRMDPGCGFDYDERIRHYHRLLRYWRTVVSDINPSLVVFSNSPHTVSPYILYAVCVEEGVEIAIFTPTKLPDTLPHYHYLRQRVDDVSPDLKQQYEHLQDTEIELTQSTKTYLEKISEPTTDQDILHSGGHEGSGLISQHLRKVFQIGDYVQYLEMLFTEWESTSMKNRGILPEKSKILGYENVLYKYKSNFYKQNLKDKYQNLGQSPNFSNKYVYFPLHYQPERATLPKGGRYHELHLVAEMLSECVPSDWSIFIKEHPYQFAPSGRGQKGRSTYHYDDFIDLDNVILVPIDTPTVKLSQSAEAVATVTGTAGWEAINMGTPALVFGTAWYGVCSGAIQIENLSDLRAALKSIEDGLTVDESDIRRFAGAVEDIGYRVPVHEPESGYIDVSTEVDRYVAALTEFVEL